MIIGEKIRYYREMNGFSQEALAEKCRKEFNSKIYNSQIRKYESGNTAPRTETLQAIGSALNGPIRDLRNETEILEHRKTLEENTKNADTKRAHPIVK